MKICKKYQTFEAIQ